MTRMWCLINLLLALGILFSFTLEGLDIPLNINMDLPMIYCIITVGMGWLDLDGGRLLIIDIFL